jgi:hypothetical protein
VVLFGKSKGMEENQFQELSQTFTAAPPIKPRKRLPKRTLILIVIVILFVLAVLYIKATGKSKNQQTTTASMAPSATESPASSPLSSETPSFSPTPTSTPRPSVNPVDKQTGLDRSQLNVVIQNGSGEAGVAVKASDYLKGLGYNVSSTGNAETYDFINVFIQVKADKSDYLRLLKKDLGFNYTIGTTSADLSSGAGEDALVIIGK